ncbi:ester cyclase [Yeosuana marina]|uniref:ester cyclase n=1 Tax=Yeosuana marina TaxID=1565536 RepID=UPI0030EC4E07
MKKLFLLGLTVILFYNCEKPKQRYFIESPEITAFKASISEYGNGDWETWHTHFADTAKLYINSLKSISATDLENAQKDMLTNFSSYGFQDKGSFAEMVIDNDDETWVNYWANWHGTLKANGKEVDVPVHITAQYIDGKVVEMYDYYDSSPITNALAEINAYNAMPADEKMMMDKINTVVNEFYNKKDASALSDILSDDFVKTVSDEKVAAGSKGLVENMNPTFTAFPDFKITILHKSCFWDGNVVLHWQLTGTNTGEFNGIAASGNKVKVTGMSHIGFNKQGKIAMEDVYYDNLSLMTQIGQTLSTSSK